MRSQTAQDSNKRIKKIKKIFLQAAIKKTGDFEKTLYMILPKNKYFNMIIEQVLFKENL